MSRWWSAAPLWVASPDQGERSSDERASGPRLYAEGDGAYGSDGPLAAGHSREEILLVERLRRGDREAFHRVFESYFLLLAGHARGIIGERQGAEDVVADVFVSLLQHPERFTPTQSVRAYLLWRVRRRALDVIRGERRMAARHESLARRGDPAVVPTEGKLPDELLDAAESGDVRARRVAIALTKLSDTARTIVLLRLRDDLAYDEIAHVVGISPSAVKMQLSRALKNLRANLGIDGDEGGDLSQSRG